MHFAEVLEHLLRVARPELANQEQRVLAKLLLEVLDKAIRETLREMLARVESESFQLELANYPLTPVDHVLSDLVVGIVQVSAHQKVRIARLVAHRSRPVLVVPENAEDASALGGCVVVCSREMVPVVFL